MEPVPWANHKQGHNMMYTATDMHPGTSFPAFTSTPLYNTGRQKSMIFKGDTRFFLILYRDFWEFSDLNQSENSLQ